MFNSYRKILAIPGALKFSAAGFIARFPMAMVGISIILMVSALYGNYTIAGQVSAVSVISYAIGAPFLSRLIDRYGQSKIMFPCLVFSIVTLIGLILIALYQGPAIWLYIFAGASGATSGSLGSLVRSRWIGVVKTPREQHVAFAMESGLDELAYMLGPVLATVLSTAVNPASGLMVAILFAVSGGIWFLSQKGTEPKPVITDPENRTRSVMFSGAMLTLAVTYVFAGAIFGATDIAAVAFSNEQGVPVAAGVLLGLCATGSFISALLYGTQNWRRPLWQLFALGVVLLACGASTFTLARNLPVMGVMMFITGFAIAPTMTNVNNIVQRIVHPSQLTEGLTWMSTSMCIGISVGAMISGRLVDEGGAHSGYNFVVASAWVMVAMMAITLPVLRRSVEKNSRHIPDS